MSGPRRFACVLVLGASFVSRHASAQVAAATPPTPASTCADSASRSDARPPVVSLVQLLATPERFDGCRVRVVGYVHLEFEGNAVYLHREDFEAMLLVNALGVAFRPGTLDAKHPINDHYVLLEGTFGAPGDHVGYYGGGLRDISSAEPMPSRADLSKFKVLKKRVP